MSSCAGPRDGQGWGGEAKAVVSWEQRVRIALDAARGLEYLHEKVQPAVTHKDVRSTNVLLFEGFRAKIADYNMFSQAADMARLNRSTHTLGSFGYQAPEYVHARTHTSPADLCLAMADRSRHGFLVVGLGRRTILLKFSLVWGCSRYAMTGQMNDKSDVYSFGIVLLELLTGRKPLDRTLPQGQRSLVNWVSIFLFWFSHFLFFVLITAFPSQLYQLTQRTLIYWSPTSSIFILGLPFSPKKQLKSFLVKDLSDS